MENVAGVQSLSDLRNEGRFVQGNETLREATLKRQSILDWYRIFRVHHHWTLFQAIRYALWLAR